MTPHGEKNGGTCQLVNIFEQLLLVCFFDVLGMKLKESSSLSKPRSHVKYFASVSIIGGKLKKKKTKGNKEQCIGAVLCSKLTCLCTS